MRLCVIQVTLWLGLFWGKEKKASLMCGDAQINYNTIKKELLAIVYAFDKFRAYLVGQKVIVYSDHTALKYLLTRRMQNQGS